MSLLSQSAAGLRGSKSHNPLSWLGHVTRRDKAHAHSCVQYQLSQEDHAVSASQRIRPRFKKIKGATVPARLKCSNLQWQPSKKASPPPRTVTLSVRQQPPLFLLVFDGRLAVGNFRNSGAMFCRQVCSIIVYGTARAIVSTLAAL